MHVAECCAGHPFSTPITVIMTHEQRLTSRKLGHFLIVAYTFGRIWPERESCLYDQLLKPFST